MDVMVFLTGSVFVSKDCPFASFWTFDSCVSSGRNAASQLNADLMFRAYNCNQVKR